MLTIGCYQRDNWIQWSFARWYKMDGSKSVFFHCCTVGTNIVHHEYLICVNWTCGHYRFRPGYKDTGTVFVFCNWVYDYCWIWKKKYKKLNNNYIILCDSFLILCTYIQYLYEYGKYVNFPSTLMYKK